MFNRTKSQALPTRRSRSKSRSSSSNRFNRTRKISSKDLALLEDAFDSDMPDVPAHPIHPFPNVPTHHLTVLPELKIEELANVGSVIRQMIPKKREELRLLTPDLLNTQNELIQWYVKNCPNKRNVRLENAVREKFNKYLHTVTYINNHT